MLPVVRHDTSRSVARLRYRGVDRRLDFVWRPGGVDRIGRSPTDHTFGSGPFLRERCWAHPQIHERFAAVPFEMIFIAASQDGAMKIACHPDSFWCRVQSTGYLSRQRLFGVRYRAVEDPQLCCKRVHDPGLRRQLARAGCIESGSTSNQRVHRKTAPNGETVSQSLCRKTVRVG